MFRGFKMSRSNQWRQSDYENSSTRYCPCGSSITWSGWGTGWNDIEDWVAVHKAHVVNEQLYYPPEITLELTATKEDSGRVVWSLRSTKGFKIRPGTQEAVEVQPGEAFEFSIPIEDL